MLYLLVFNKIPIIHIPGLGELSAETACEQMKVQSHNDHVQLEKAKELMNLKVFNEGVSIISIVHTANKIEKHFL